MSFDISPAMCPGRFSSQCDLGKAEEKPTNFTFWLNQRARGEGEVRRGSRGPTPLNKFSYIALNLSKCSNTWNKGITNISQ